MKFGLYHVDFATQKRTLRPGARFYECIVRRFRGLSIGQAGSA